MSRQAITPAMRFCSTDDGVLRARIGLSWAGLALIFAALAAGCAATGAYQARTTVRFHTRTASANHGTLRITYPYFTAPAGLNGPVQRWIGAHCPLPDTDAPDENEANINSARVCVAAMADVCRGRGTPSETANSCVMHTKVDTVTHRSNRLALVLSGSVYTGGAHGVNFRIYHNMHLPDGAPVTLADVVACPQSHKLRDLIEARLRAQYGLVPGEALTRAGFYRNTVPVTDNILIQAAGLRFTYQNYEISPYAMGEPSVFVDYDALGPLLTPDFAATLSHS